MLHFKAEYFDRLLKEFNNKLDPRARAMILEEEWWMAKRLKKNMTITCIGRTVEENSKIGGYKYSAHLIKDDQWIRAWDQRVWDLSNDEIELINVHLQNIWNKNDEMIYIQYGLHGNGRHIHVNIKWAHRMDKP